MSSIAVEFGCMTSGADRKRPYQVKALEREVKALRWELPIAPSSCHTHAARPAEPGRQTGFRQPMDTLHDKNILEKVWANGRVPWKKWA